MTGERAEMSKLRLYESNDSREMLKGSFSSNRLLLVLLARLEVVEREDELVQKLGLLFCVFVGDGGTKTPLSLISDSTNTNVSTNGHARYVESW